MLIKLISIMELTRRCQLNGKTYTMDIPALTPELLAKGMEMRRQGAMIQTAFYFLNAGEREFLMTGMTPEHWDQIFGPMDETLRKMGRVGLGE